MDGRQNNIAQVSRFNLDGRKGNIDQTLEVYSGWKKRQHSLKYQGLFWMEEKATSPTVSWFILDGRKENIAQSIKVYCKWNKGNIAPMYQSLI